MPGYMPGGGGYYTFVLIGALAKSWCDLVHVLVYLRYWGVDQHSASLKHKLGLTTSQTFVAGDVSKLGILRRNFLIKP